MKLIINADDFGLTEGINRTTLHLHKLGIVTSASIIANGDYFHQAVDISKENPSLGVGVHLCLDGPFNIAKDYNTIVCQKENQFYDHIQILKKLKDFSVSELEIYKEFCLQIEKVLDHKILISHLDSHHHLHLYLPALKSMISVAEKFKIPFIRTQKVIYRENQAYANYIYRYFHHFLIKILSNCADGLYEPAIEDYENYENEFNRFVKLLKTNYAILEIMLHPRQLDDPQTIFFTSTRIRELLKNQKLVNYLNTKC